MSRYNSDGLLDRTFGRDGRVDAGLGREYVDLAVDPTGKIVTLAAPRPGVDADDFQGLVRYLSGGALDTTFGTGGQVVTRLGASYVRPQSLTLQPDGKIVAAATVTVNDSPKIALTRYLSDGRLDTAFDGDGIVLTDVPGSNESAASVLVQPDGSIVVAGAVYSPLGRTTMLVVKYLSTGVLDATFDGDGIVNIDVSPQGGSANALTRQSDGKLIIAGVAVIPGQGQDFAVARLNPDGTLDRAFDTDGIAMVDFASRVLDVATGVAVLPDGRIAVSGYSSMGRIWISQSVPDNDADIALAIFTSSGTLDATFDGDGKTLTDLGGKADRGADLALRNGQLVVAGASLIAEHSDIALVRYNSQPSLALDLRASSDTGISSVDNVTKSTSLSFDIDLAGTPYYRVYRGGALISAGYQTGQSFTATTQPTGVQAYTLEFVDAAGNVSAASRPLQVTIDTTAPAAPSFTAISDDTGTSNQDRITSDPSLVFFGTAEANSLVRVARTGVGYLGASATDRDGKWIFDYTSTTLSIGSHLFTGVAEDVAGNVSPSSPAFQVVEQPAIVVDDPTVTERTGATATLTFTVRLSRASSSTVRVDYSTAAGTASSPADFASTAGTLAFSPGITSRTIGISVIGDALDEINETVMLNLRSATNAIVFDAQGVGTIVDDDPPPSLVIGDIRIVEGASGAIGAVFTVRLSAVSGLAVTVDYATTAGTATAGSDFTSATGTLTFAPGETLKTITVFVLGDMTKESDETLWVMLKSPVNASLRDDLGLCEIVNDD